MLISFKNFATHIVGGEIFYEHLSGNTYKITLKLYRDCYTGLAPYDDPATIFIFDASGNFLDSLAMPFPGAVTLPPTINNPCFTPPTDVCVQEAIYTRYATLPPIPGGYNLTYQRCCRNGTILNLINPGDVGSTYMAHIPDPSLAVGNSSPHYNRFPPIFLCAGVPLVFDHSATDPDGDSLYYELCDPFTGLDPCCPILGSQAAGTVGGGGCSGAFCPIIADPPPYSFVPWLPPYNASYPMSAAPGLAVDPHTGLMTGTPNMIGQWVVGVCVSEYRHGVLLDVNKRDFQFNVVNCPGLPVAAIAIPTGTSSCLGFLATFLQNSQNAFSYQWDFGDPTTTSDVSTLYNPTWLYPDSGTYTITLIINGGTTCADTNVTQLHIQHLLDPSFIAPAGECITDNSFNFLAGGDFLGNGTFSWNFGAHATPQTVNLQNVNNVVFDSAGLYPVTLTVTENGCTETYTSNIIVYPKPEAYYGLASGISCDMQAVHFIDSSKTDSPLSYEWLFGDGHVSSEKNPFHVYPSIGLYSSTLIISTIHGCRDTFSLPAPVAVNPSPTAGFYVTPKDTSIFYPDITLVDLCTDTLNSYINWGDGTSYDCDSILHCNSMHSYTKPGSYQIMQVVENEFGCRDTAYSDVLIRPEFIFWIPNAFTPGKPNGLNDIFKPKLIGVHEYTFLIFDRWGEKIYEGHDPEEGWNGYYRGRLCTNDVFVYKITFRDDVRNDQHQYIGHVTLVR